MIVTRRGFFGRLFGAATAALVAPYLPTPAPMLAFRRSAFHDATTGIAIRFVQQYDVSRVELVNRLDVLYGAGIFREPIQCRIEGA